MMGRHSSRIKQKLPEICPEIPTNKFKKTEKGYLERISGVLVSVVPVILYS